jgi:single-stranded-DNA-specific exonuclease
MSIGINCLLADNDEAYRLAYQLDSLNRERRDIETGMKLEALQRLEQLNIEADAIYGLALYDESWHQGVIGILASRIKDKIHRPVIIFAPGDEGEIKGSARSIKGIHIRDVLEAISTGRPGLIKKFGGHAMAAGLTIDAEDFPDFLHLFNAQVKALADEEMLENVILSDGELAPGDYTLETVELLEQAGPWGQEFPEPVFSGRFQVINQRVLKDRHYKLVVRPENTDELVLDGIAFNQLDENEASENLGLPEQVELVYKLSVNDFRGQRNLQLMIDKILT